MKEKHTELETCRQTYELPHMSERQIEEMKHKIEQAKQENRKQNNRNRFLVKTAACAAAVVAAFVILPNTSQGVAHAMENIPLLGRLVEVVTFRDYQYESDRHMADIEVPEFVAGDLMDTTEEGMEGQGTEVPDTVQENLKESTAQINAEIQKITDGFIQEFEKNLEDEWGYQDIMVKSEIMNTTQNYFTLKLICYQGAGSGAEWNYYYTLDLNSGERLQLKDLFREGTDYITPISENIITQMREQMAADEQIYYWVDDEDIPEWNFKQITDETAFYINEKGNIVISFNEGDVAPMYMGVVTFEIPDEVVEDIRIK